jgi:hypothetical protein
MTSPSVDYRRLVELPVDAAQLLNGQAGQIAPSLRSVEDAVSLLPGAARV